MKKSKLAIVVLCCFFLTSCAGVQLLSYMLKVVIPWGSNESKTGKYKVGNPYVINGVKYYPKEDWYYDEKGIASWYGGGDDNFHGKKTANGEIYNTRDLTAAHKTLPMPSFVKVTNLENGRRVVLRINDRGPYVKGRIIDVSQKAAELLGFANKGTAKVRVQILTEESKKIADAAKRGKDISEVRFPRDTRNIENFKNIEEKIVTKVPVINSDIYIQVGSYSVKKNAEKLRVKLSELGNVTIEKAMVNGILFHRVQVGPLVNVDAADYILSELESMNISSGRVIVK